QAAAKARAVFAGVKEGSQSTGDAVGGILGGGGIGDLGGDRHPERPPEAVKHERTELTAEWLEFVIQAPGRPPQKIRRPIFDLIGPAARARQRFDVRM